MHKTSECAQHRPEQIFDFFQKKKKGLFFGEKKHSGRFLEVKLWGRNQRFSSSARQIFLPALFSLNFLFCEEPSSSIKLSLVEAEKLALSHNQQIQEIENLVEKARLGHLISISDFLPKLELISHAFRTERSQIGGSNSKSTFLTQFLLTQTLFSSEKYYNLQITNLFYKELHWIKQGIFNDILYDIRKAYCQILLDKNQIETAATHVEVLKALALQMETRLGIGTATTFDVNQLQVAVSNALTAYYKAIKALKTDLDIFTKLLGYDPGTINIEFEEEMIPIQSISFLQEKLNNKDVFLNMPTTAGLIFPSSNPERQIEWINHLFTASEIKEWEQAALKFRPDIMQAKSQWKIALKEVSKAQGEYLPRIELQASYGGMPTPFDEYPRSNFSNQDLEWGVGITFKWNLFDSFKRERQISANKAVARAEKSKLENQIQEALKDVRDQIFSIENAMATNISSESTVKLAKQSLVQTEEKLEIGYLSIFDYQIAVNNYIEAMNIYFNSQFELINAYYLLRHATGIDLLSKEHKEPNL